MLRLFLGPGGRRGGARFIVGLDFAPFVRRFGTPRVEVGDFEQSRPAVLGVASTPLFGDDDEAQRHGLADGRGDSMAVHAVFIQLLVGERQPVDVIAAMDRPANVAAASRVVPKRHPTCALMATASAAMASARMTALRPACVALERDVLAPSA